MKLSISAGTTKWKTNTISVGPGAFKVKVLERKCIPFHNSNRDFGFKIDNMLSITTQNGEMNGMLPSEPN